MSSMSQQNKKNQQLVAENAKWDFLHEQNLKEDLQAQQNKKSRLQNNQQLSKTLFETPKIVQSPFFDQYNNDLIRNRKIYSFRQYLNNFPENDISYRNQSNNQLQKKIKIIYSSKNHRIVHYEVKFSFFRIKIKIFNIQNSDSFAMEFDSNINNGAYGNVYQVKMYDKIFAVKEIQFKKNRFQVIQKAIEQYAMMKLMSALECGPKLQKLFGFDIVISNYSVYFSAERCIPIEEYSHSLQNKQEFNILFDQLELELILMHSLKICHNDIKPLNIMYSPQFQKLIFIDFGLSQVKQQCLGYMKPQTAKGSFFYCCNDMKQAFINTGQRIYVDTYYNDYFGLKKTKQCLIQIFKYQHLNLTQNEQLQLISSAKNYNEADYKQEHSVQMECSQDNHFIQLPCQQSNLNFKSNETFFIFLTMFLLSQSDNLTLERILENNVQFYRVLQQKFEKYSEVFLEIQTTFILEQTYQRLKNNLLANCTVSFKVKSMIANVLDPYFQKALAGNQLINQQQLKYLEKQKYRKDIFIKRQDELYSQVSQSEKIVINLKKKLTKNGLNQRQMDEFTIKQQLLQISFRQLNQIDLQVISNHMEQQSSLVLVEFIQTLQKKNLHVKTFQEVSKNDIQDLSESFQILNIRINFQQEFLFQNYHMHLLFSMMIDILMAFVIRYNLMKTIVGIARKFQKTKLQQILVSEIRKYLLKNNSKIDLISIQNIQNPRQEEKQYDFVRFQCYQRIFTIMLKLLKIYSPNSSYVEQKAKVDKLVLILKDKLVQVLICISIFQNKVQEYYVWSIINTILELLYVYINQIIINTFLTAQNISDYQRIYFYYDQLFNIESSFNEKISFQQNKTVIRQKNRLFLLTRSFCSLIVYRIMLPRKLYKKYEVSKKSELMIKSLEKQNFYLRKDFTKNMETRLIWQYFHHLIKQNQITKALQSVNQLLFQNEKNWSWQIVGMLTKLYGKINNDKQIRLIRKKMMQLNDNCYEMTKNVMKIDQDFIKIKIQLKNKQCLKPDSQELSSNQTQSLHSQQPCINKQKIEKQLVNKFKFILETLQKSYNQSAKLYSLKQILKQSLKTFPNQDRNLTFYLDTLQNYLDELQTSLKQKIKLFKNLRMPLSLFEFANMKADNDFKIDDPSNYQIFYFVQQEKKKDSRQIQRQEQFWAQILRQQIIEIRLQFVHFLIVNSHYINDKKTILEVWKKQNNKLSQLIHHTPYPLSYLQVKCRVSHLVQLNKQLPKYLLEDHASFVDSSAYYLKEFNTSNPTAINSLKYSSFYIQLLISIYSQKISIKGWDKFKSKNQLIQLFDHLVQLDQIYMFFVGDIVYDQYLCILIQISFDQRYNQIGDSENTLLHKIMFNLCKENEVNKCPNYSRVILKIVSITKIKLVSLSENCSNLFSKTNNLENNSQKIPKIFQFINFVLKDILIKLIFKYQINSVLPIFLGLLGNFLNYLNLLLTSQFPKGHSFGKDNIQMYSKNMDSYITDFKVKKVFARCIHNLHYSLKEFSIQTNCCIMKQICKASSILSHKKKIFYLSILQLRNSYFSNLQQIFKVVKSEKMNETRENQMKGFFQAKFQKSFISIILKGNRSKNKYIENKCTLVIKKKMIARLMISMD